MSAIPVIAIFDVGKTNKKLFLFDEQYRIVYEQAVQFPETKDEDGDPCEDVEILTRWVINSFRELLLLPGFNIKAVNFSAYGASFVHIGASGSPVLPLYNYLKPYPETLQKKFYKTYGGKVTVSVNTASPVLGSLNSGMQLYRLKYENPEAFEKIDQSLHLPQYLNFLITGKTYSDITSIGCHTNLWNFAQRHYHEWVYREDIIHKLAPVFPCDEVMITEPHGKKMAAGVGLHDSSSALIPYLASFDQPFILISTGTWCISLNPFNHSRPTVEDLQHDCLCYLTYKGENVKASRLFAGYEHEQQVKILAGYFHKPLNYYENTRYDEQLLAGLKNRFPQSEENKKGKTALTGASAFSGRELAGFKNYEEAYCQLMIDIMRQQVISTRLVINDDSVKRIFVDGGFSRNAVYMELLADAFPEVEVYAASVPQATAIGAGIAIHHRWSDKKIPGDIIELKLYSTVHLR